MNFYISNSKFKEALKAFSFIFILVLILYFLRIGLNSLAASHTRTDLPSNQEEKIAGIISHQLDADIAVFGSSVAWVHFDPIKISDRTNKTSYNFGLDATPLQQYKGVLKEFLTYSKAKVIVIAGTFGEFMNRDKIYLFNIYKPYLDNKFVYSSLIQIDPDVKKLIYIPFYDYVFYNETYNKILTLQNNKDAEILTTEYYKDDIMGFHPVNSNWMEKEWMKQEGLSAKNAIIVEISEKAVDNYREIISEANKGGKKVVLVLTPMYIEGQEGVKNLDEIRKVYRNLAGEDNYFLDFTTHEICFQKGLFYNYVHLNEQGADIFSEEFANELLKLGIVY